MNPRWPFPPLAAGSLPLGPVIRVTVALFAGGCIVLTLMLWRSSSVIVELAAGVRQQTLPMLEERERALVALSRLAQLGASVFHAGNAAERNRQRELAERIAGSADFDFDAALKLRVLNVGSALREIDERLAFAAALERRHPDPARARRLRDEARVRWQEVEQTLDYDLRALAAAARRSLDGPGEAIETAALRQRFSLLWGIGVMLTALLGASTVVLRWLLAPILRTVRALETVETRLPVPSLPSSPLAEVETVYRAVERHAASLSQADALSWRSVAIEASTNAIIITNAQGVIEYVNPAFTAITGYAPKEALGQTPRVLKSGSHGKVFYEQFWKTILSGREWRGELLNRRRDGTLFNDLMTVSPVFDERGRIVRFIAIHYDITRRKEVERQLRARTEDLQRYRNQREAEDALARAIFDRQLRHEDLRAHGVAAWQIPATQFSGDIVAARAASDGRLFVLLGDATGHGLSAAISVLPLLARFESLVGDGHELRNIVYELNRGMCAVMPIGHFVAATLLCIDRARGQAEFWLGGLPDLLLLDGKAGHDVRRFKSDDLPLGVSERAEEDFPLTRIPVHADAQFALYSDGLIESRGTDQGTWSKSTLEALLCQHDADTRLAVTRSKFLLQMDDAVPHDDVSFVLVETGDPANRGAS